MNIIDCRMSCAAKSHAYSKDTGGEDVLQCENRDSHCCSQWSEKQARKLDMLPSECTEQKDSPVSVETQKHTSEKNCSPNADAKQIICHPNLNKTPEVRYDIDSSGRSNAVKSGEEFEDCKKILTVSQLPDACSGAEPDPICLKTSAGINHSCQMKGTCTHEASTLAETDKFNTDQYSSLCNNSGMKRKLSSSLITFCRRSKRNTADIAAKSAILPAASCLVDLKNEKEHPEDNDNSWSFPAPAPAISTLVLADNPQHFPHGEAAVSPNAAAHCRQDSQEQMEQQKVCIDVQDNHHINVATQRLPNEDVMSRITNSDVSGRGGSIMSLDLSVPPHASHNIDCNLPLDGGSDENPPVETSELLHDSLGSTSKMKEEMLSLPVQHVENGSPARAGSDKGKCSLDSPPVLTCNASKNKYIQFLPESRSDSAVQLGNNSEKVSPLHPSSLQSSNLIGLSLQPEQMVDGRASFPLSCEWPNVVQSRESFRSLQQSTSDRTQSFARDKMMLDNILTRARAVRGSRSSFLDKFEYPTTWLDEELDSLWIGVRRHGRGNWDAILGDRRLHFLPWKTSWDLAERWQVEQSRLLSSMPVSLRRYTSPPDFSSESILRHPRPEPQVDEVRLSLGLPLHFMNNKTKGDVQRPVTNTGVGDESSSSAGLTKGSLPHWLRTLAEIPPGLAGGPHVVPSGCHPGPAWLNQPGSNSGAAPQQPWLSKRYISAQRRPEPQNGGKAPCSGFALVVEDEHPAGKQEDLIIIPSDASSEETISDDHSIRP
ncbi:uncharacterized protein LOC130987705 isoform X2 [Salvia miltiorrhiza]|uniref:uncharacterized protein LOC130987705 isoform X2 n=1 Tax=Salvia miltiorrhiza TaxID=226208 RepID=UPI0025AC75D6|nr:uncharacterized protein LOC130987705 isoform X2 [Salvia miltiorrhiza]